MLRAEAGDHHLWVCAAAGVPLAVIVPLDPDFAVRLAAAARLHRALSRARSRGPPPPWRLTAQQRHQFAVTLRALDGRHAGASQREIARVLFGRTIDGRAWLGSDLHSRVKRLLRTARGLVAGGYLGLLRAPERRPLQD